MYEKHPHVFDPFGCRFHMSSKRRIKIEEAKVAIHAMRLLCLTLIVVSAARSLGFCNDCADSLAFLKVWPRHQQPVPFVPCTILLTQKVIEIRT